MDNDEQTRGTATSRVLIGVLIIAAGLIMLADRSGVSGIHLSGRYWPFLLIGLGLVRLIDPGAHRSGRPRSRRTGAWVVFLGLWFLVNELHLYDFDYHTSWPLLVVGAGIQMVWRAVENPGCRGCRVRES
jgi:hypothetical protein